MTDLQAIRGWNVDEGVPAVGDWIVKAIVTRIESLRDYPGMDRIVPEFDRPFVRELIHPPYRFVDCLEPNRIRIVRVWRSDRRRSHLAGEHG